MTALITYPNQRIVTIHRESAKSNFLGIKNENWFAASRDLGATALRLYLYFAANANNFNLALSPVAVQNDIGMPQSTYRDQFKKLIEKGYLVQRNDTHFDFYEMPHNDEKIKEDNATGESIPPTAIVNNYESRQNNSANYQRNK